VDRGKGKRDKLDIPLVEILGGVKCGVLLGAPGRFFGIWGGGKKRYRDKALGRGEDNQDQVFSRPISREGETPTTQPPKRRVMGQSRPV